MMRKGSHMSEEARAKIRAWHLANSQRRGVHLTDEQKRNLSEKHKASEAARKHREQLAASRKGKPRKPFADPVAHSLALSKALRGKPRNVRRRVRYTGPKPPITLELPEFPGCCPETGKDVENVASVYAIVNTLDGKLYVGSSRNTEQRWYDHRHELVQGKHRSHYLQHAWDKYGRSVFAFRLLEIVVDPSDLLAREQYWIHHLHAASRHFGYNTKPIPDALPPSVGEQNGRAILTDADIPVIRARLAAGEQQATLAREYGISKSAMHMLAVGKSWRHIADSTL